MAQVSWRADDKVVERAKHAARRGGWSLNEYLTLLVSAATDPQTAGREIDTIRERLALAGLLEAAPVPAGPRPSARAVAAAGRRAARGTPLDELVTSGR